jgi:hypothetical protein
MVWKMMALPTAVKKKIPHRVSKKKALPAAAKMTVLPMASMTKTLRRVSKMAGRMTWKDPPRVAKKKTLHRASKMSSVGRMAASGAELGHRLRSSMTTGHTMTAWSRRRREEHP